MRNGAAHTAVILRKNRSGGRHKGPFRHSLAGMSPVTFDSVLAARPRGAGVVLRTPVIPSTSFSAMAGAEVWLKAENLQRTGSFKIRGAMNALSRLTYPEGGVVAASAGNHAQGVALAAAELEIAATVFMPEAAAIPKVAATRGYGATVRLEGATLADSVDHATRFAAEADAALIHPYDDPNIVAGQGTLGLELLEQLPETATVVLPVGGGGLIGGVALAIKHERPDVRIIGVQSAAVPTYVLARESGNPIEIDPAPTVADGIAVSRPSPICFDLIEAHVDDLVTVDDASATEAVALLLERAKLLVEPSGAVTVAAILGGDVSVTAGPVVAVLSGGNIDLLLLDGLVRQGLASRGRFASLRVLVPDQPGNLAAVLARIGTAGGNVLSVSHHREEVGVAFGDVEIHVTLETRSADHFGEILEALADYDVAATQSGRTSGEPG